MSKVNQFLKGATGFLLAAAMLVLSVFLLVCILKADSPAEVATIVTVIVSAATPVVKQITNTVTSE